jgi:hypothetical protein
MDTLTGLRTYKDLADWYERQGQPAMRDRFLVLAADAALSAGQPEEAERLRQRLLQTNPHHMLKPFSSFQQALQSSSIQIYIHDLRMNYPPETAQDLLQSLRGSAPPAAIPPTAPVIDFESEPTLPLGSTLEPLKVYPLREEPEPTLPPTRPTAVNRSASDSGGPPADRAAPRKSTPAPGKPPRPAAVNTPAPRPAASAARPHIPLPHELPARLAPAEPESTTPGGAWFSLFLFGMTATACAVLAAYTLARPFLPAHWLP